jgi:uncharacterized protein (TIGR02118 family)
MIKFVVAFRQPATQTDFENAYNDFLALVERMPSIKRRQVVHVTGSPRGEAPYYRLMELYFEHDTALKAALLSDEGQEAGNELARFEPGSFDVFFAEVYEEEGGSTPAPGTS